MFQTLKRDGTHNIMPDNIEDLQKQLREVIDTLKAPSVGSVSSTPRGWSSGTVAPYYKEAYAIELKVILDTLLEEDKDFLLRNAKQRPPISKRALEAKLSQAFHYLIDHMDSEKKYAALRQRLEISLKHPDGVMLRWKRGIRAADDNPLVGESINSLEVPWRDRIINFVETAKEGGKLEIHEAGLSSEEFEWLNEYLRDISDVILHPKSDTSYIKLLKSSILKEI